MAVSWLGRLFAGKRNPAEETALSEKRNTDIRCVLIVGAGTMGQQIGLQCATHGYEVVVYDIAPEALEAARAQVKAYAAQLAGQMRMTGSEADAALARIRFSADPADAARADLLSESVPEDPALKAKVFAQFNQLCPPHTIFTTNSSSLIPSMFAAATGRPAQFAALHFHSYVWDSNVVDIMPHPGTSPETVEVLNAFARRIGQIPIVLKKENYGYVFNAMFNQLNTAAVSLVASGVASIEDVDRAWMGIMKMPLGPFGWLDGVGLKTVWDITQYWATQRGDPQLQTNADFLKQYVDKNWLGVKTGRGFYTYPDPAYARPGFLTGET
jgi:3-hydroxybutyryl-CoA dehydrogenase